MFWNLAILNEYPVIRDNKINKLTICVKNTACRLVFKVLEYFDRRNILYYIYPITNCEETNRNYYKKNKIKMKSFFQNIIVPFLTS